MPATIDAPSQCEVILAALQESAGWVPMPLLAARAGCYAVHSRIADLRRRGCLILNRTENVREGKRLVRRSFYRLL